MSKLILLDSGPLGIFSNPGQSQIILTCRQWVDSQGQSGHLIVIPEICDYEVRRELLRANKAKGIERLNLIKETFAYLPITTAVMLKAAEFWAQARKSGTPTAVDSALDADVILAAQAAVLIQEGSEVVIASNPRHLSMFVAATHWESLT